MLERAKVMLKIAGLMASLPLEDQRLIAFDVHRTYGGPLTAAQRQIMSRARNGPVTNQSLLNNGCLTDTAVSIPVVLEASSTRTTEATEILGFLNTKAKRSFRYTAVNLNFIEQRLAEGATLQECKSVIARQCRLWLGDPKMSMYLRPETLFNKTKFESYRGMAEPEHA